MKPDQKGLEDKLKALDKKIAEVKKRMPAHSIKPPIMMELFELEDERELIEKQIIQLKKDKKGGFIQPSIGCEKNIKHTIVSIRQETNLKKQQGLKAGP